MASGSLRIRSQKTTGAVRGEIRCHLDAARLAPRLPYARAGAPPSDADGFAGRTCNALRRADGLSSLEEVHGRTGRSAALPAIFGEHDGKRRRRASRRIANGPALP